MGRNPRMIPGRILLPARRYYGKSPWDSSSVVSSYMEKNPTDLGPTESFPTSQLGGDTSSQHGEKDLGRSESFPPSYPGADLSSQHVEANLHSSTHEPTPPSSYSSPDYHSSNFQEPPPASTPDISAYPQHYPQPYSEQHSLPQSYHPPENTSPSFSYPNFQSYPSFQDTTLPTVPTHQPSYYHNPDVTYSSPSVPPPTNYLSTPVQYDTGSGNGNHVEHSAPSVASYKYDPNYQPPVEKITEAHKAARFAVGALAFDDVAVAVDFLCRSLELLTNPSAESH